MERLSNPAYDREQAEAAMRAALDAIGKGFIESLKSDTYKEAIDAAPDVNAMSNENFSALLAERMNILDEEERKAATDMVARKLDRWQGGEGEPLSLREEILLELQAMIKRHNYYAGKG